MTKDYEHITIMAEHVISEAKLNSESENDIKLYYDLYDELGSLQLTPEDLSLYRSRLDIIFGNTLQ